jgi:glucose-1-phosphate adenylyltransferase
MKSNNMMGVVFGNTHDALLGDMTKYRAISSLPFGGRYRLIDFSLSNLVNADVTRVAVVTDSNYKSLMDHLGSGKSWDLARRHGGLYIMPPYIQSDTGRNADKIHALNSIIGFLEHNDEEYVVLCDGDTVSNINLKEMLSKHIESGAEITAAYTHGAAPAGENDVLGFTVNASGRITDAVIAQSGTVCNYSLDIAIVRKDVLIRIVEDATAHGYASIARDIFVRGINDLDIYGYKVDSYAAVIDSMQAYVKANMDLLKRDVRNSLTACSRPIFTKVKNDMPAKYGLDAKVKNSLIADGCIIEGEVENSVLFRGVKVGKGTVVKNCILMQGTSAGKNASLEYVCTDKNVTISDERTLSGTESYTVYIRKGSTV